jgi:hypothetical protein
MKMEDFDGNNDDSIGIEEGSFDTEGVNENLYHPNIIYPNNYPNNYPGNIPSSYNYSNNYLP